MRSLDLYRSEEEVLRASWIHQYWYSRPCLRSCMGGWCEKLLVDGDEGDPGSAGIRVGLELRAEERRLEGED